MKEDKSNSRYKSMRVKAGTYKNIKRLSVETDIPMTRLIDIMYDEYIKSIAHLISPP